MPVPYQGLWPSDGPSEAQGASDDVTEGRALLVGCAKRTIQCSGTGRAPL